MTIANDELTTRVLLMAPTAKDVVVTHSLLDKAGMRCVACADLHHLSKEVGLGAGAVLITDEVISNAGIEELLDVLARQPAWSDLPIVILMRGGVESPAAAKVLGALRNVTLLEKPAPMRSVVSAVQAAVRGRLRQYQIRDQIEQIHQAHEDQQQLMDSERAARSEAERANLVKDEFLATLSHELRTPLNTISMCIQFLKTTEVSPQELPNMRNTIDQSVHAQTQLISDLLDVSRIVSGKLVMDKHFIDLRRVIDKAVDAVASTAADRRIELVRRSPDEPIPVYGDPLRLQQVIWNLLANAIKFTPTGGRVELGLVHENNEIELSVTDTGCGIEAAFLPHIFERFRQADSSFNRKFGGLGLGLSIAKQIVELQDGELTAESKGPDQGATFRLKLHNAASGVLELPMEQNGWDLCGLRVMIVDDDVEACRYLKSILENSNAVVTCTYSGQEALEQVDIFGADILLSDIGMPEMSGNDLIRKLRDRKSPSELPAVAITAFAGAEDRQRVLQAGFQSHITKPINGSELIGVLANLDRRSRSQGRIANAG